MYYHNKSGTYWQSEGQRAQFTDHFWRQCYILEFVVMSVLTLWSNLMHNYQCAKYYKYTTARRHAYLYFCELWLWLAWIFWKWIGYLISYIQDNWYLNLKYFFIPGKSTSIQRESVYFQLTHHHLVPLWTLLILEGNS